MILWYVEGNTMTRRYLEWIYLEDVEYSFGIDLQGVLHKKVSCLSSHTTGFLLLVEHRSVITIGRFGNDSNILYPEEYLREKGIGVHKTSRGGDVTFHGPGQLVVYPIINLKGFKLGIRSYVRLLEETIIEVLKDFDIVAERRERYPGVWIGGEKIASIGIQVRKHTSMHGVALNVSNDLDNFSLIVPCGIREMVVTSIKKLTNRTIPLRQVAHCFANEFGRIFDAQIEEIPDLNRSSILRDENRTAIVEKPMF
jgi:lipoyl(octanoyl) transferase